MNIPKRVLHEIDFALGDSVSCSEVLLDILNRHNVPREKWGWIDHTYSRALLEDIYAELGDFFCDCAKDTEDLYTEEDIDSYIANYYGEGYAE